MDQSGRVANPARCQLNIAKCFFPCPRSRLRIWSRETGFAVSSCVSLLILHTQTENGAYSRDYPRFPRRRPHLVYHQPPSGQSRVCRATQLRANGVHCRGCSLHRVRGPQRSSSNGCCCLFRFRHGPTFMRLSFPTPTHRYVVWPSSHKEEYGSTGQGCQSCSWTAEPGKCIFSCPRSRNLVLTHGIPPDFSGGVHIFISSTAIGSVPSLYQVTQMRADGVHCREPVGTGSVVPEVVPVTGDALSGITMHQSLRASLFSPSQILQWACAIQH